MLSQHNNLTLHLSWRFTLVFSQAARVEYPLNSTNTVLWTGSSPATADGKFVSTPDGLWSVSDELALPTPIPDNAMFWVRLWQSADASPPSGTLPGLLFHDLTNNLCALDVNGQPAPFNDRSVSNRLDETNFIFNPFPAIIDKPVFQRDNGNGTQTCLFDYWDQGDPYGAYPYWISTRPLAILGPTQKPSFTLWGDSRVVGLGDTYNGLSNNRGEVERSIGNEFAYINFGIPGMRADDFLGNTAIADQYNAYTHVAKTYTTNLIEDLGGADIISLNGARAPRDVLDSKKSIWTVWTTPTPTSAKSPSSIATLTLPCAASAVSGQWTTFDQTDASGNSNLDALNGLLRAGVDVQMIPACDHAGTPRHFHSSTTSGSACLMRIRIRASISPPPIAQPLDSRINQQRRSISASSFLRAAVPRLHGWPLRLCSLRRFPGRPSIYRVHSN
jgi:hypothetical protein